MGSRDTKSSLELTLFRGDWSKNLIRACLLIVFELSIGGDAAPALSRPKIIASQKVRALCLRAAEVTPPDLCGLAVRFGRTLSPIAHQIGATLLHFRIAPSHYHTTTIFHRSRLGTAKTQSHLLPLVEGRSPRAQ